MKVINLLHNPGAGDGEHLMEDLVSAMETEGYKCHYASTKKKGWQEIEEEADVIAVAGGDGTVRKAAREILHRKLIDKTFPIALLPYGTANNIAKTLNLEKSAEELIASWKKAKLKKYDVGRVSNIEETDFFLESLGFGIFPYLMKEMKNAEFGEEETPETKILAALKMMHKIVLSYEPKYCRLEIDGADRSGKFLLAEIMNTRSIGPNIVLSPDGDPGDGQFEVVLIPESDKEKFADYILGKINGSEDAYNYQPIPAKKINISWEGSHLHVDDELIKTYEKNDLRIEIKPAALEFLV